MARDIDFSEPLDADDLAYIKDRPWLVQEAALQGVELVEGNTAVALDEDDSYENWTVAELKAELKERDLAVDGNKSELIARLEEADEAEED